MINHVPDQQLPHKVYLYHRVNREGMKADLLDFQNNFLQRDLSSVHVEEMWLKKLYA